MNTTEQTSRFDADAVIAALRGEPNPGTGVAVADRDHATQIRRDDLLTTYEGLGVRDLRGQLKYLTRDL